MHTRLSLGYESRFVTYIAGIDTFDGLTSVTSVEEVNNKDAVMEGIYKERGAGGHVGRLLCNCDSVWYIGLPSQESCS